jgi:hypothetical protein
MVFWLVTSCILDIARRFAGTDGFHHQLLLASRDLLLELPLDPENRENMLLRKVSLSKIFGVTTQRTILFNIQDVHTFPA